MISVAHLIFLLSVLSLVFSDEKVVTPLKKEVVDPNVRHSLGMKVDKKYTTLPSQIDAAHKARIVEPHPGVEDPKVMDKNYKADFELIHKNLIVDTKVIPMEAQEEEVRRNLRTYTNIPQPYQYSFASSGQFFETGLYTDYMCKNMIYSFAMVNNVCNTAHGFPSQRIMTSTQVAINGGLNFFVPTFTAFNDSSCVEPVAVGPLMDLSGVRNECMYNMMFGYYTRAMLKNVVPTKHQNTLLIRAHKTAWHCHNKKTTENVEYKIVKVNECFYDPYKWLYVKVTSCDKNTHTGTVKDYWSPSCADYSEYSSYSFSNTDECQESNSLVSKARGFLSYTCL